MEPKCIIEISTYSHLNINIYINIYVKCLDSTNASKFYYWQTCGKGMFRIFRFLKIVKEDHELLKACFEEPKSVSVKNKNRQIINRNRSCFNKEYYLSCSFVYSYNSYNYMYKNKTEDIA